MQEGYSTQLSVSHSVTQQTKADLEDVSLPKIETSIKPFRWTI